MFYGYTGQSQESRGRSAGEFEGQSGGAGSYNVFRLGVIVVRSRSIWLWV